MKRPEHINSICKHHSALSKLTQRAHTLEQLNHVFQQTLPTQFSAHCRLANLSGDKLIIHTDNPSYASLIRFQAPVLCKTLSNELNTTIKHIEIKVRQHFYPKQDKAPNDLSLPNSAAKALLETANDLDEGPLKTALNKLAKRHS
jgi:hypothetical protein